MKLSSLPGAARRRSPLFVHGYTLLELVIALFAAFLLAGAVVALTIFTAKAFAMIGNYADMDAASRNAIDTISREIRDASDLLAYSTNNPSYLLFTNATAGTATKVIYNADDRTVTVQKTGEGTRTFLTQCDSWDFSLYNRVPIISATNVTFYTTTALNQVKLINLSWTCSRSVLGSKLNTEIVLTAQVVMRNKVVD